MDIGGRFTIHHLAQYGDKGWTVMDHSINGWNNLVRDWRSKGSHRKIWRSTKEEAEALRDLLNKGGVHHELISEGETSKTQRIMYANIHRERREARRPRQTVVGNSFTKCPQCGKMSNKGNNHCVP
jgi:hypothetical protein